MKKTAAFILSLTLVLVIVGCSSQDQSQEDRAVDSTTDSTSQTNSNAQQIVEDLNETASLGTASINYPSSWSVTVDTDKQISVTPTSNDATACIQIEDASDADASILPEVANNIVRGANLPDQEPRDIRNLSIDGIDALKFNFSMQINGIDFEITGVIYISEGVLTSVMAGYGNEQQKTVVDDIIASIRIDNSSVDQTTKEADQNSSEKKDDSEKEDPAKAEEGAKASSPTVSQNNALATARDYLDYTAFSYDGLVDQLEFEGFSNDDAIWAVDNCGADWNEQAEKKAQDYLDYSSFSRSGLIDQLVFEGFTQEQAEHGADSVGL